MRFLVKMSMCHIPWLRCGDVAGRGLVRVLQGLAGRSGPGSGAGHQTLCSDSIEGL